MDDQNIEYNHNIEDICWTKEYKMPTKRKMPAFLQSLASVRLDRFIPCIAIAQTILLILMSFRIYNKLDEALSTGITPKLPRGTLSAVNESNLPKLAFNGRWLSAPSLPRGMNIREEQVRVLFPTGIL